MFRPCLASIYLGGLAQLVERVLSMHEVSGSIPEFSMEIKQLDEVLLLRHHNGEHV